MRSRCSPRSLPFVGASCGGVDTRPALWLQAATKIGLVPVLLLVRPPGTGGSAPPPGPLPFRRGWIVDSAQFALLGLVTVALAEIGTLMLGYLSTPEEAGLFRIASRAFLIAGFVAFAAQQAYGPRIARTGRPATRGVGTALAHDERGGAGGSLAALIGFALLGRWISRRPSARSSRPPSWPALIMVGGAVSASVGAMSPRLLKMTGEQRIVFRASVLSLAGGDGLNLALIPDFGAMGCAMASVLAVTLGRVLMNRGVTAPGVLGDARPDQRAGALAAAGASEDTPVLRPLPRLPIAAASSARRLRRPALTQIRRAGLCTSHDPSRSMRPARLGGGTAADSPEAQRMTRDAFEHLLLALRQLGHPRLARDGSGRRPTKRCWRRV
jgi:hypothetical protein